MADLSQRAMLVDLTIKQWSASRTDKAAGRVVSDHYQSDGEMGRYAKRLVGKDALERLRTLGGEIYLEHRRRTLPWLDSGPRILSSTGYLDYAAYMRGKQIEWESAVDSFCSNYPGYVADAQTRLNGLFDPGQYPTNSGIWDKFFLGYSILPMPSESDFRVDLADIEVTRIRQQIESGVQRAVETAMADVAGRITQTVSHMAERLSGYTGGRSGSFRDSLVDNVRELVEILPSLNLTGDPDLGAITTRMRDELLVPVETLRESESAREQVQKSAEEILNQMAGFVS